MTIAKALDMVDAAIVTAAFEHPRYGGGSGCWYPATLKYGPSGWMAEITCPFGYFEKMPPYDIDDLETQIDGVLGHSATTTACT